MINSIKEKTAVALGTFDGLHIGHMSVINKAVIQRDNGLVPVILMFSQHPLKLLTGTAPKELWSGGVKEQLLKKTGCRVCEISFEEIHNMTPEEFFYDIIIEKLNAGFVSCGFNYKFGKNGAGDTALLRELCQNKGIVCQVSDHVDRQGEPVSSTRIRKALQEGDAPAAASMLGRYFSYDFTVVSGDRRGRLLGFPTINQFFPEDFILPKFGVYASATLVEGRAYPSVTNIGVRPTVEGVSSPRSETCILGFSGDLYGQNPQVALLEHLRDEEKFPSFEDLSRQMERDSAQAAEIFKGAGKIWD